MKELFRGLVVIILLSLFAVGCGGTAPAASPMPSVTPAPTDTAFPTPTASQMPTSTSIPFSLDQLSGYFAYASEVKWTTLHSQNIEVASPDWSVVIPVALHPSGLADHPVWSPDGLSIVYTYYEMESGLYNEIRLYDFSDDKDISLTPQHIDGTVYNFSWSPDSRSLIFELLQTGTNDRELYKIDIKTKELVDLSNDPDALEQEPAWSPNGDLIAFASDRDGSLDIWTMSPDGSDPHNLTGSQSDTFNEEKPCWSPDGAQLAYYRYDIQSSGLWVMNADGSGQRLLLDLGTADYFEIPAWSPNGEWIALISGGNPVNMVWLANPSTGATLQASAEPGRYGFLTWAPDSSAIAYLSKWYNSTIHIYALDGIHEYSWELDTAIYFLTWSP